MIESIVITSGRSGSTYLTEVLNHHPSINCHGELWNPGTDLGIDRYKNPLSWMKQYYATYSDGKPIQCSKSIISHAPEILNTVALDSTIKKIVLIRKNALAVAVSSWFANRYNSYNSYADKVTEPESIPMYYIDKEIPLIESQNRDLINIEYIPNTHIIYYEDFCLEEFNKVFQFLGADPLESVPQGRTPDHTRIEIANRYDIECIYKNKYDLIDRTSQGTII